jgi:hypothetical protein
MGAANSFETEKITAQKKVPKADRRDIIGDFQKRSRTLNRQLIKRF